MKIIVIGCPGSGKSTFSQKLNKVLNVPLFHLDMLYHNEDGTRISKEKLSHIYELIEKYKDNKKIVIFKSREEADKYLLELAN